MAKISEHEKKMMGLQYQLRQNNADLQNFLHDMDSWEEEMKIKDSKLKEKKPLEETKLPPVRNSLDKKKKKKVKKKKDEPAKPKRISSYDYRSWDKFDVDAACASDGQSSSGSEYETDEEWETERKKQAAVLEKDKGNEYFKKGDYDLAIECYTKGSDQDPTNPLLPANRAMALLKQAKYGAAELDCSVALSLDPLYTKAYLRRGSARMGLQKFEEAKQDYERVLQLEPQNKKAKADLEAIEKELSKQKLVTHDSEPGINTEVGIVKAIYKAPHERSTKRLRRIEIEEVGFDDDLERRSAISSVTSSQSQAKRDIVEREGEMFQKFTANSPADIANIQICDTNKIADTSVQEVTSNVVPKLKLEAGLGDVKSVSTKSGSRASPKGSPSVSPRQFTVPTSSIQFQADYKLLKNNPESFYQYFKDIKPSDYPKLFGQFLDDEVLVKILTVMKDFYVRDGVDVFDPLQGLTVVKRFSMVAMFLSKKDKQVLKDLFTHMRDSGRVADSEVSQLAAKFDIR